MPIRPFSRSASWLWAPSYDELVPADHPARFVAEVVDALTRADWADLGIDPDPAGPGAAAYAPRALLGAWLHGLLTGVRTARRLETACREQLPLLWLTGGQRPDHNTLWRFYRDHREGLGGLLGRSVRTAVKLELVDLALQAVDGTKIRGAVSRASCRSERGLQQLLDGVEEVLRQVDARHAGDGGGEPVRLPAELHDATVRKAKITAALDRVQAESAAPEAGTPAEPGPPKSDAPERASPTDPDARLQKLHAGGVQPGYNGQAAAAALDPDRTGGVTGQLITAAVLTNAPHDHEQLGPLLDAIVATTGEAVATAAADTGYFSSATLEAVAATHPGTTLLVPDGQAPKPDDRYHKDHFAYDPATDTMTCPEGRALPFSGLVPRPDGEPTARRYRAPRAVCAACPVRDACTRARSHGRSVTLRPDDARLKAHRARMATDDARERYRRRKALIEPVFGRIKDRFDGRQFYLRGLAAVRAEWQLLAAAFNYRVLWRIWRRRDAAGRAQLVGAAA